MENYFIPLLFKLRYLCWYFVDLGTWWVFKIGIFSICDHRKKKEHFLINYSMGVTTVWYGLICLTQCTLMSSFFTIWDSKQQIQINPIVVYLMYGMWLLHLYLYNIGNICFMSSHAFGYHHKSAVYWPKLDSLLVCSWFKPIANQRSYSHI